MSIKCVNVFFYVLCNFLRKKNYKEGVVNNGGILRTTYKLDGKPAGSIYSSFSKSKWDFYFDNMLQLKVASAANALFS